MKKTLIGSALGLALFASPAMAQPLYSAINPANGHTYYLLPQNTWTASESAAVALGGHLATVRSSAEENWIYSTFSSYGGIYRNLLIGLTSGNADGSVPGNFYWVSGDTSSYRNWFGPEPSDAIEHFTEIIGPGLYGSGGWNNIPNVSFDGYSGAPSIPCCGVVEVVPEPAVSCLALVGLSAGLFCRSRGKGGRRSGPGRR
jgi:hypothetical protein